MENLSENLKKWALEISKISSNVISFFHRKFYLTSLREIEDAEGAHGYRNLYSVTVGNGEGCPISSRLEMVIPYS